MDWNTLLINLANIAFYVMLVALLPQLFQLIKTKIANDKANKYLDKAESLVSDCVKMVNQTFVDSLKKEGKFDIDAQKVAFTMCADNVEKLISNEMKEAVALAYNDFNEWLLTAIDAKIADAKKEK